MAKNDDVKNKLQNKASGAPAERPPSPAQTITAYLEKMAPEIQKALPDHVKPDRLARIALTTIRTNPALLECTIPSLLGAVMQSAQLGLEPGLIGHCYFVPFWNNKEKRRDVQFIIGYKGMIDLARRSGHIESIYAHAVYETDEFDYELGLHPKLVHKPATGQRGAITHVYAVAHFKDGGYQFEVFSKDDIEKTRKRSKASDNGPWKTDYEEMAKKTVIRRMWKYLPISIEIQQQVAQDETIRKDITAEAQSVYDENVLDLGGNQFLSESEQQEEKPSAQDADPFDGKPVDISENDLPFD
ncbi:recombination protein RecT [Bacillus amyloliquefaciens]|uniref:Recombinase RecT n=1 Tax=Bacillus amyloliquefaciens TaxID=1390 RepID=A0AAP7N556_BACAM|nr:recombination protein RecT [Bacillus amyloliquefaciens]OIK20281.1 recombinase RecT [Bacillus amyloliquefaciens]